jgi:hypothetical protein
MPLQTSPACDDIGRRAARSMRPKNLFAIVSIPDRVAVPGALGWAVVGAAGVRSAPNVIFRYAGLISAIEYDVARVDAYVSDLVRSGGGEKLGLFANCPLVIRPTGTPA